MIYRTFLLLYSFIWVSHAQSNELVACIDEHPPYQILAEKPYGVHITALEKLAKVLDKKLKFINSPNFARCVAMLRQGQVDVIAGLNPSEERNKFAFYAPFKAADDLRVVSKEDISIDKYEDFHGKIIGIARGSSYFPRFDKDNSLKKITIQNVRIGFSLLLKGRIDLIMVSPATFETFSKEISEAKLKVSPIRLEDVRNKETAFGFSKYHQLNLDEQEIIKRVVTAYKQGQFEQE